MEIGAVKNFDILFLYENTLGRLKNCIVQEFKINVQTNVVPFNRIGSRETLNVPTGTSTEFMLTGVAQTTEMSVDELERVEIVKRIDAYKDLKRKN